MRRSNAAAAAVLLCWLSAADAASIADPTLADLSLEELSAIEITSVSRRAEPLSKAAASVYVITSDDIRRSGATTLPEALRLAPNLQVAQLSTGQYAITARGFNNAIGNKLLVLIDGRTVYAPFFSGVLWDQQQVVLADIERIEVISGPGGTLWGTNAVNGVINVVSRTSSQTQGGLAVGYGGNVDAGGTLRYGGTLGTSGTYRVYAQGSRQENTKSAAGVAQPDGMDTMLAGFRADWTDANGGFTLQGSASQIKVEPRGFFGPFPLGRVEVSQANVLGRWSQLFANGSDLRVQAYLDYFKREDPLLYRPEESVFDIEFQHGIPLGAHRIMWGAGYRHVRDDIQPGLFFGFVPPRKTLSWANVFAQDEVALADKVTLTFGARVEHNDFTGTELLPSARLAWQMNNEHLLWTAASRAVRAPARLDRDLRLPPTPPYIIAGGPDFESEVANVFELGYRGQLAPALSYSVTAFYQDWDKLRSGQLPPDAHLQNMIHGNTSGIEAWATWQPLRQWRLSAGVTTLHKDLRLRAGSTDPSGPRGLGNDPGSQWMFRSSFDLPYRQEFDVMVRRVAELPQPVVPAYTAVDLRYGWHINDSVEISAVVRNLFDAAHPEFNAAPDRSEIARSMLVQLRWSL